MILLGNLILIYEPLATKDVKVLRAFTLVLLQNIGSGLSYSFSSSLIRK